MPCVGSPCSSARTRWRAAASAIFEFAPAFSRAVRASRSNRLRVFLHNEDSKGGAHGQDDRADRIRRPQARGLPRRPAGKPRGGIVVIQEIFGVNSHIKSVADGYRRRRLPRDRAGDVRPRAARTSTSATRRPRSRSRRRAACRSSPEMAMMDVAGGDRREAAKAGKVGIVGYCWGGSVAWMAAAQRERASPARCPTTAAACSTNTDRSPRCR